MEEDKIWLLEKGFRRSFGGLGLGLVSLVLCAACELSIYVHCCLFLYVACSLVWCSFGWVEPFSVKLVVRADPRVMLLKP